MISSSKRGSMERNKKKLGIIGGMGPLAAAVFYREIVEHTDAECDQDHIVTYMISNPEIPKRVEYILGKGGESPEPALKQIAKELERMGAEIIAMPCVTAHFFYKEIRDSVSVPVLNILDETVERLKESEIGRVGILATEATIKSEILQDALHSAGIGAIAPDEGEAEIISRVIFKELKTGKKPDTGSLISVLDSMKGRGAETCLIACTDLSVCFYDIKPQATDKYLDLMDILADAVIRECVGNQS